MCSSVRPRRPAFSRQLSVLSLKAGLESRRRSLLKAIWPSIRAKGAPKQKWAAQPNSRCRLSGRSKSKRSGPGNRLGSRFAAASTATTLVSFRMVFPPSYMSAGAIRAVRCTGDSTGQTSCMRILLTGLRRKRRRTLLAWRARDGIYWLFL